MRIRSAGWLIGVQVANALLAFPLSVLLARSLGASGKGVLSLVQLIAETGGLVFALGMSGALTFYAARRQAHARDAVKLAVIMSAVGAAVTAGLVSLAPLALSQALFKTTDATLLYLGALGIAVTMPGMLLMGYTIGKGEVRRTSVITVSALGAQVLVDGVLAALGRLTTSSAILVWLTATFASSVALALLALQGSEGGCEGTLTLFRRGRNFGLATWLSNISQYLALRQDLYLIALFLRPEQVGVYTIAVTFAQLSTFIPNALSGVLMPKVAGASDDSSALTARLTRTAWPLAGVVAAGVFVVAAPLIAPIFGPAFAGSVAPLAALVPAMIPYSVNSTLAAHLSGSGRPILATRAWAANLGVNVVANVILLPRVGVVGAGLASLVSYSAGAVVMSVAFRRLSGLRYAEFLLPRRADFVELSGAVRGAVKERGRGLA